MDIRRIAFLRQLDPLIPGAIVTLFLAVAGEPWWSLTGAASRNLLTIRVSPYYFQALVTGVSSTDPFEASLGSLTRILLFLTFVSLTASVLRTRSWWRDLAMLFSLSALAELYLSFLLMYHAAQTALLGSYGVVPPYSGSSQLPVAIVGLDLSIYPNPLVTAGFGLPFYLGFVTLGLVGGSMILNHLRGRRERPGPKGVGAIFTAEPES